MTEKPLKPNTLKIELPRINFWVVASLLITLFFLVLLSLLHSKFPIFMDEALFSDMVNRFNHGLGLNTPLFQDFIPHIEQYSYWYPPIYFYSLAPVYLLFGASITVARLFSLVCAVIVLGLINFFSKHWYQSYKLGLITLLLLITDHYFQDQSIVTRMEMLTILWGVLAILLHLHYLSTKKNLFNLFSGVLSVLSLLTHPIAVVILLPIAINLLFLKTKNFRQKIVILFSYGFPILLGLLIWILSFWSHRDIFWVQNLVQLHRKQYSPAFVFETFKYKPLHRLVLSIYYLSNIYFLVSSFINKKYQQSKHLLLMILGISSIIIPILMKEMGYLVFTSFFGAIILTHNIEKWYKSDKQKFLVFILPVILALNGMIFFNRLNEIILSQDYFSFSKTIAQYLPQNAKVLTASFPDPFFYLEKERPDLQLRVTPNNSENEPIDLEVYSRILSSVDYIVVSFFLNSHIYSYVDKNLEEIVYDSKQDIANNRVWIIKLKPPEDRTSLTIEKNMQWQYPKINQK